MCISGLYGSLRTTGKDWHRNSIAVSLEIPGIRDEHRMGHPSRVIGDLNGIILQAHGTAPGERAG